MRLYLIIAAFMICWVLDKVKLGEFVNSSPSIFFFIVFLAIAWDLTDSMKKGK
jgi:hypothetical protein